MKNKSILWFVVLGMIIVPFYCLIPEACFPLGIPQDNTQAEYLYIFGPKGNPYDGADDVDHEQSVFINVPEDSSEAVVIQVYDPDTGGFKDQRPDPQNKWDTAVAFSVYGNSDIPLENKVFAESPLYDRHYYSFGPFRKEDGRKIGNVYQFKLIADALEGEDQNLFKVRIFPENAEVFSHKISFRLLPHEGEKMLFYAEVPAGVTGIVVENYDLDPKGGTASLKDPLTGKNYRIAESNSGRWAATPIELPFSEHPRRVVYTITKKTQQYANAALRVKDDKGNVLPIYYAMGRPSALFSYSRPPEPRVVPEQAKELKCNKFTFDATGSYDLNRDKLSYLWDFGDGTSSTEPVVTHEYAKGGDYTVKLSVKDSSGLECDTSSSTQKVKVSTPPQVSFTGPDSACTESALTFDASTTTDDTPDTLTYAWDFGDGTKGQGKTVTKTYAKGGMYKVALYVDDNSGSACSSGTAAKNIDVNSAPIANAGADVNMCFTYDQDLKVEFNGYRSHDPDGDELSYEWDFGDGETASGKGVTHIFRKTGDFTATLTVNDRRGSVCSAVSDTLSVRLNRKPVADAGADIVACVNIPVNFDGSQSRGENLKYSWNFADGQTAEGVKVSHVYSKGGYYTPVLTVDDGKSGHCSVSSSAVNVFVNTPPEVTLSNEPVICAGNAVRFDASANDPDGDMLIYTWDFGDGTVVKGGASETHEYTKGGAYKIRVRVDDGRNTPCPLSSATSNVRINSRPVANAGPNLVCCIDREAVFDASGSYDPDGDALSYYWNFGDGATAEGVKATHSYSRSGEYTVTLRVEDNAGTACSSSTASFQAKVNESPVSVILVK